MAANALALCVARTSHLYIAYSIPWPLMNWQCKEPGHHQPWYWSESFGIFESTNDYWITMHDALKITTFLLQTLHLHTQFKPISLCYYRKTSSISRTKSKNINVSCIPCSCLRSIHWSQVLSWKWRCSWSSADRRCSNYIWVINNFIAYWGATYIRGFTVDSLFSTFILWPNVLWFRKLKPHFHTNQTYKQWGQLMLWWIHLITEMSHIHHIISNHRQVE